MIFGIFTVTKDKHFPFFYQQKNAMPCVMIVITRQTHCHIFNL